MGTEYIVQPGDYLVKIAKEHGYDSWRDIYYHEDNAEYRKRRPDPNEIYAGDRLILPDKEVIVTPDIPDTTLPVDIPPTGTPPGGYETPPTLAPPEKKMFNMFWAYPLPLGTGPGTPVSFEGTNTINTPGAGIPAVILYPALATPEILVGEEDLELLILVEESCQLTTMDVNLHLKFSEGLDRSKPYFADPLFFSNPEQYITIIEGTFNDSTAQQTQSRFAGLTDVRVLKLYQETQFDQRRLNRLFMVSIKSSCLFQSRQVAGPFNTDLGSRIVPREPQDLVIHWVLSTMNGPNIKEGGKFAFRINADNVDLTQVDMRDPIQAYHPVFWYKSLGYVSLGHLADLHLSARQNILAKSAARVIEFQTSEGVDLDQEVSPPVGNMISICSRNVKQILDKLGSDDAVDVVVITGDLIDYIRSWFPFYPEVLANPRISTIWSEVALDDTYLQRYQDFVDLICFHSMVMYFYDQYKKPIYLVNGNHDCYLETYGISPRVSFLSVKANPGIAADHNLTIYEAILAFGNTYDEWKGSWGGFFTKECYQWFYTVLTPFSDFVAHLPGQSILGLAWGDDENMMDVPGTNQGLGHLPRAKEALSSKQLEFLNWVTSLNRKIILISHFTYVNYDNPVPAWSYDQSTGWHRTEGTVSFPDATGKTADIHGDYDFGTFSVNRHPVYWDTLLGRKVQLVLSGHSHRKGLYGIPGYWKDGTGLNTRFYEFWDLPQMWSDGVQVPGIVVCDSAGPLPRVNRVGELAGQESDYPSGNRILVDKVSGEIISIESVPALHPTTRPRLAVAIDYFGNEYGVFKTFRSDPVSPDDEYSGVVNAYSFLVELNDHLASLVCIQEMRLYLTSPENGVSLVMPFSQQGNRWWLTGQAASDFYYTANFNERRRFLAVKFGSLNTWLQGQVDCESWWNSECWIDCSSDSPLFGDNVYEITRPPIFVDIDEPDLDWRQTAIPKYK